MASPKPSQPGLGIFWMLVTGLCFVAVTALVKIMGPRIPAPEAAFLRYFLGLVFLLPMIRPILSARLTKRQWTLFGTRGFVHCFGVMLWFFGMTQIPLAEVTAMNYMSPVYVTIGAALFLGEKLALRRIFAICMAMLGALIILRPGFREVNAGHLAMLVAAVFFAASYLLAKIAVEQLSPAIVVGMLSICVTIGLAPFAAAVWVTPTLHEIGLLFAVACFATAGHFTMTLAFQCAPLTVTQPVTFLQLIWAATLGAVAFHEAVDIWVVLGGLVIMASVTFITWRESRLKRPAITPPQPATKV
jgi:drug/metabolite transporter (DMT)-like permease